MVNISGFSKKWNSYKGRACKISPYFAEFEDGTIGQDDVAKRIPKSAHAALLQDDAGRDNRIAGAAARLSGTFFAVHSARH
jgi:hypothetical protein